MVRNSPRRRVLFVFAIVLVGLLAGPIDECDDYDFLNSGSAAAHHSVCTCLVCELTTDDSFAPNLEPPRRGEAVASVPAVLASSTYLPGIFRPPIA
jgi:hypothetical protein